MGDKKCCKASIKKEKKTKYVCRKCGLKASKEKHLCKPEHK